LTVRIAGAGGAAQIASIYRVAKTSISPPVSIMRGGRHSIAAADCSARFRRSETLHCQVVRFNRRKNQGLFTAGCWNFPKILNPCVPTGVEEAESEGSCSYLSGFRCRVSDTQPRMPVADITLPLDPQMALAYARAIVISPRFVGQLHVCGLCSRSPTATLFPWRNL
jgi:hypothetical protein